MWPIVGTLTGTTTSGDSGPENNGDGDVLDTPQISRTLASPSDTVYCQTQEPPFLRGGLTALQGIQLAYSTAHWQGVINE